MRVVHATAWYPPEDTGGTEVYVEGLVAALADRGVESEVLRPREVGVPASQWHECAPVTAYPVEGDPTRVSFASGQPHGGFDHFTSILKDRRPAIYHQHSWTRGCGSHHLRAAKELGFRTVLTLHVPGFFCLRGTMLRYGREVCDGVVGDVKCGACWLEGRGVPRPLAAGLARLLSTTTAANLRRIDHRIATGLAARAIAQAKITDLNEMIVHADKIVAPCQWIYAAMRANGASKQKLVLCRQGVADEFWNEAMRPTDGGMNTPDSEASDRQHAPELKLLYVGRWDPLKGVDVVVRAMQRIPASIPVSLTVRAVGDSPESSHYRNSVQALARGDRRIKIGGAIARSELSHVLRAHDVLVVPSVWLETGPLILLEARAVGLFVLGSRLGGIAELVADESEGSLVTAGDCNDWAAAIRALAHAPPRRRVGRSGPIRRMSDVADEMMTIYRNLH